MKGKRKPIHPKVKAGGASGGAALALVEVAGFLGLELPLTVAGAIIVLAGFVGGYVKSA